jgi:membrane protease YdiL (CAAX protease family)
MQAPVLCRDCGTENSPFADLCDGCYRELEPPVGFDPSPFVLRELTPPPPPPPVAAPALQKVPQEEWKPTIVGRPAWQLGSADPYFPLPASGPGSLKELRAADRIKWRWKHLWAFGFCAWGVPRIWGPAVENSGSLSQFLDTTLLIQIVGYVLAAFMAAYLVNREQNGDWSTLGLTRDSDSLSEAAWGAGFGLLLLAAWTPISLMLTGGKFTLDALIKVLVGSTSGPGLLLAGIVVVIGAPIIEEIYYRGLMFEKLNRKHPAAAIGVTSLLFVAAHGSILILPLWLMAIGLAVARRKGKSLWFTIGAHSSWNFAVLLMGAFIVFSPNVEFTAPDGAYTLRHPSGWERSPEMEGATFGANIDLAVTAPNGSYVGVARIPMPPGTTHAQIPGMLLEMKRANPMVVSADGPPIASAVTFNTFSPVYEYTLNMQLPDGMMGKFRNLAVLPQGSTQVYIFQFGCPEFSCAEAQEEFDRLINTVTFAVAGR